MHDELTKIDIQKMREELEHRETVLMPQILEDVKALVFIPNAGGRMSEHLLPQPERLTYLRWQVGEAIARLSRQP